LQVGNKRKDFSNGRIDGFRLIKINHDGSDLRLVMAVTNKVVLLHKVLVATVGKFRLLLMKEETSPAQRS